MTASTRACISAAPYAGGPNAVAATLERYGHGTPDDWIERNLYTRYSWQGVGVMLLIDHNGAAAAVVMSERVAKQRGAPAVRDLRDGERPAAGLREPAPPRLLQAAPGARHRRRRLSAADGRLHRPEPEYAAADAAEEVPIQR